MFLDRRIHKRDSGGARGWSDYGLSSAFSFASFFLNFIGLKNEGSFNSLVNF